MYSADGSSRKRCPKCEKKMVKRYAEAILLSSPPKHPWDWFCGCGYRETGGMDIGGLVGDDRAIQEWKRVNGSDADEGK